MTGVAVGAGLLPAARGPAASHVQHEARYGPLPVVPGDELIAMLGSAGLRGRGGAGFPAATKLAAVSRHSGPRALVANGTEGEPMSAKDRALLERSPHLVLDGARLAADAISARETIVCVSQGSPAAIRAVESALAERGDRDVRLARVPVGYLSGQETALLDHLGGGPGKPTRVPPLPIERGLRRRPTLVQNVETLAQMALIVRRGPAAIRAQGTPTTPGTLLATISGAVRAPGVYELPGGTLLGEALELAGTGSDACAVLVGGYFGSWFALPEAGSLALDHAHVPLGAGALVVLDAATCPLAETARVARWLADANAGQCGPCINGLPAIAGALETLAFGRAARDPMADLLRWTELVRRRGACHHPDGVARFVSTALAVFAEHVRLHIETGPCAMSHAPALLRTP